MTRPPRQATEGSYHKTQQEEDLKEYRLKRLKEGGLKPDPTRLPFNESDLDRNAATGGASGDKLAEIYAQEARLASQDVVRRFPAGSVTLSCAALFCPRQPITHPFPAGAEAGVESNAADGRHRPAERWRAWRFGSGCAQDKSWASTVSSLQSFLSVGLSTFRVQCRSSSH